MDFVLNIFSMAWDHLTSWDLKYILGACAVAFIVIKILDSD